MKRSRIVILAAALALAGCGHDLPGWKVATTEHFRLYTDQNRHSYESVLDRLEDVHAGLSSSLFSTKIRPTEVFLFEPGEFQSLLGPVGGVAVGDVGRSGVLVIFDGWDPAFINRTAAHELSHAFIDATFRAPPVWFNEGFATYAESILIQEHGVLFGSRHVHVAEDAERGRLVKVSELFSARYRSFHGDWETHHYTTAWALVHYIWHGENRSLRSRFDAFGAALSAEAGRAGGSLRAWQTVFPDVPIDELDGRLLDHVHEVFAQGKDSLVGFRFVRPERQETSLAPADMTYVDLVREQLRKHRRPDKL